MTRTQKSIGAACLLCLTGYLGFLGINAGARMLMRKVGIDPDHKPAPTKMCGTAELTVTEYFHGTADLMLGKTFSEIEETYGQCLRDPAGNPTRTRSVWPKELDRETTAQAEWQTPEFAFHAIWLPPKGADGQADIVVIDKNSHWKENDTQKIIMLNSGGRLWEKLSDGSYHRADKAIALESENEIRIYSRNIVKKLEEQSKNTLSKAKQ